LDEQLEAQRARALQTLVAARQALQDAETRVAYLESEAPEAEATRADAQVIQARAALDDAEEDFEDYVDLDETDLDRVQSQIALANARLAYVEAVRASESLSSTERSAALDLARTALEAAEAELRIAQDTYDQLLAGVDADSVASADARVQAAEAQLASAEVALDALTLHAPIGGTVVRVTADVGEAVAPAVPVVVLADLSEWWIETENLTQIDVVSVQPGQQVSVVVDPLPDVPLVAQVVSIDRLFEDKRGDVTYTAHLRLDDVDPRLRWGMTCALTFQTP
jgi:multidrug resistance efflux pump